MKSDEKQKGFINSLSCPLSHNGSVKEAGEFGISLLIVLHENQDENVALFFQFRLLTMHL